MAKHLDGGRPPPRLAILMPVFNDQVGLERSLASLAADEEEFDVYVVDDGSDPVLSIPAGLPYQVHLLRQVANQGITSALNLGLARITAAGYEYVARLDAGDLSLPGRFAAQLSFLDTHAEHALVGTAVQCVDPNGTFLFDYHPPTEHDVIMCSLRYRAPIIHPTIMVRMKALIACGLYRDRFAYGEDYDLFMRLGRVYRLGNLGTAYVVVLIAPDSLSSKRQRILLSRLKLLVWYFDFGSIHSYLGLTSNVLLLLVPRSLVLRLRYVGGSIKRFLGLGNPGQHSRRMDMTSPDLGSGKPPTAYSKGMANDG